MVVRILRQFLGLLVIQILQPVFQIAQENIGCTQLLHDIRSELTLLAQQLQHLKGWSNTQTGITPSTYQLEHLGNEFDFADTAGPKLDIVHAVATLYFLADLCMQFAHRFKCAEVEIFAKHKGPHELHKFIY